MMFRCVIVAAVSTPGQVRARGKEKARRGDQEKESIPGQVEACRQVCERRGWAIAHEIIIPGHSRDYDMLHEIMGACAQYKELIHLVEAEEVNLIVCRWYDRLWRTRPLQAQVSHLAWKHHCQIYAVEQPIEPMPPDQMPKRRGLRALPEDFAGAYAEEDQARRVSKTHDGMMDRIKAGLPCTCNVWYGYRRIGEDGLIEPDPEERMWLHWIFERRAELLGHTAIARELNRLGVAISGKNAVSRPGMRKIQVGAWRANTVKRILRNRIYIGEVRWGGAVGMGRHEPIVEKELFDRVQQIEAAGMRFSEQHRGDHLLLGLARCGYCGRAMIYRMQDGYRYLRCSHYVSTAGQACQNNGHAGQRVHAYVLDRVVVALERPEVWEAARALERDDEGVRRELDLIAARLRDGEARWQRWAEAYESGAIGLAELGTHRRRLQQEGAELRARQQELALRMADDDAMARTVAEYSGLAAHLREAPIEIQQRVLRAMLRRVLLRKGEDPELEWW